MLTILKHQPNICVIVSSFCFVTLIFSNTCDTVSFIMKILLMIAILLFAPTHCWLISKPRDKESSPPIFSVANSP